MTDPKDFSEAWVDDGEADVLPGTAARPSAGEPIQSLISRRGILKGTAAASALVVAPAALLGSSDTKAAWGGRGGRLGFEAVAPGNEPDVVVPDGYKVDVILRWGDPITRDAPSFDINNQTPEAQAEQFGFNADLVLWYPLPGVIRQAVKRERRLDDVVNYSLAAFLRSTLEVRDATQQPHDRPVRGRLPGDSGPGTRVRVVPR